MTSNIQKKKNNLFNIGLISLSIIITIVALLTGTFIRDRYFINVGSVSPKRFKSPQDIVNQVATDNLKQSVANSVTKLYRNDTEITDSIITELDVLVEELEFLRANQTTISNPYSQENDNNDETTQPTYDLSQLKVGLDNEEVNYLITLEKGKYSKLIDDIRNILIPILEAGVKEESMSKTLVGIKDDIDNKSWDNMEKAIVYEVISSILKPNSIYDEDATNSIIKEKVDQIKPIMYMKDQKIVDEGDIISPEAYAALVSLGFVNTSLVDNIVPIVGTVALTLMIFLSLILYLIFIEKEIFDNKKQMVLLFTLFVLPVVICTAMPTDLPYQYAPILLFTMLVAMLINVNIAIVVTIALSIISAITFNDDIQLLMYFGVAGLFSVIISKYTREKNNISIFGSLFTFVSSVTFLGVSFLHNKNLSNELLQEVAYIAIYGVLTTILCVGSLPLWETIFGIVTPVKLLELTNPKNELLRRMIIEAPGTYHHSLIVANLSETACYDIKANATLARVGSYYHDIGKLKYPQYFAENQVGTNAHDELDPYTSAKVIIEHLTFGAEMAKEYKLPQAITDIITQHHGNTLVKYFYVKALDQAEGKEVDEKLFRYPFSIPQSREAAVVMLADTVEAAVRSMIPSGKTMDEVRTFVKVLIKDKLDDGQLAQSKLTINDLDTITNSFMRVFKGMYHDRIPYPKSKKEENIG